MPEQATPTPPVPSPGDLAPKAPEPMPEGTPATDDLVVDAALRDLSAVDPDDLDAVLAAGESVHATLTSRLSDLGT
ncbi:hypothetical protein DUHN55_30700 [Helicobacter pylori]|uniref:hypothetical protein n=1 Tax=Janibacter sp. G349 TaxID=3405424 RepID=UPI0039D668ED